MCIRDSIVGSRIERFSMAIPDISEAESSDTTAQVNPPDSDAEQAPSAPPLLAGADTSDSCASAEQLEAAGQAGTALRALTGGARRTAEQFVHALAAAGTGIMREEEADCRDPLAFIQMIVGAA